MSLRTMQGLTPTIILRFPNTIDLTEANNLYVSFKQSGKVYVLEDGVSYTAHEVDIYLTQEETLQFSQGSVEVMVNWTYSTGQRGATVPKQITVFPNHILEVLP